MARRTFPDFSQLCSCKHPAQALKAEIEQLKSAAVPVAAVASGSGGGLFEQRNAKVIASAEAGKSRWGDMEVERAAEQVKSAPSSDPIVAELQEKVESYKKFIADYIVNAQNQKLLAVKEAELKAEKKFQERLEQLFANSGMLLPGSGEDTAPPENLIAAEPTLYDKRNARVVAAATAGKSRWGAMEVEKVEELVKNSAVTTEEVAASVESAESTLFKQRNAKIVAAAGAGKSRWGSKEVERAAQLNGEELKVEDPPKVKKITLEERVNLGARLLEA